MTYEGSLTGCRPWELRDKYGAGALDALEAVGVTEHERFPDGADDDLVRYFFCESRVPLAVRQADVGYDLEDLARADEFQENGDTKRLLSYRHDAPMALDATISTLSKDPNYGGQISIGRKRFPGLKHPSLSQDRFALEELRGTDGVLFDLPAGIDMFELEGPWRSAEPVEWYNQIRVIDRVLELGERTGRDLTVAFDTCLGEHVPDPPFGYVKAAGLEILEEVATYIDTEGLEDEAAENVVAAANEHDLAIVSHTARVKEVADQEGVPAAASDVAADAYEEALAAVG